MTHFYSREQTQNQLCDFSQRCMQKGAKNMFLGTANLLKNIKIKNSLPGTALMPQSMTTAPFLIQSPLTSSGCPMATTRISARTVTSFKFSVFEWHTVTVPWFHFNSSLQGVPTILDRPSTQTSLPAMTVPVRLMSSTTPFGVHGRKPERSPTAIFPSLMVLRPSTSLWAATASVMRCESILLVVSRGIWTIMPWKRVSMLRLSICKWKL